MGDTSVMSVPQSAELEFALRRNGWTPGDVKKFSTCDMLATLLPVLRGQAEVVVRKHIINCDAAPYLPDGWSVEEHIKGGQLVEWDLSQIKLWLSQEQQDGTIVGNELRKQLKNQPVQNASVLDYLLKKENQHLIPESWKGKAAFFWGTIYRDSDGNLVVRCVDWYGGEWHWDYDWLDGHWSVGDPAAVSARN